MLKLDAFEVCPIARTCEYRVDVCEGGRLCGGCNPERDTVFVCDFYKPKDSFIACISESLREIREER